MTRKRQEKDKKKTRKRQEKDKKYRRQQTKMLDIFELCLK